MTAFTLDPKPTFKLTVEIPVPGDGYVPVEFECKYRNQEELRTLNENVMSGNEDKPGMTNEDLLKAIIVGWSLSDPCTPENIVKLSKNYQGSASAVYLAYLDELLKVRRKN